MKKNIDMYGRVGVGFTNFQKLSFLIRENDLKKVTIYRSFISNELIVLKKEKISKCYYKKGYDNIIEMEVPVEMTNIESVIKGFYSTGNKFMMCDTIPVIELKYEHWRHNQPYKIIGYKTFNIKEVQYGKVIKHFPKINNDEWRKKLDIKRSEIEKNQNILYEIELSKDKQSFYIEDNYLGDNGCVSINIDKSYGNWLNKHGHNIELYIGGLQLEFNCLLSDFKENYNNKVKNDIIEIISNNKIIKLENGYVINNKFYETLDGFDFELPEE